MVQTSLMLSKMPLPPPPPKRWKHSKADWPKFKQAIDEWVTAYRPADNIDQLEEDLVEALQNATDASVPVVVPTSHQHKDNWYYCPEIKELDARMNRVHKIFSRNPTEENYELLKEVALTFLQKWMQSVTIIGWSGVLHLMTTPKLEICGATSEGLPGRGQPREDIKSPLRK